MVFKKRRMTHVVTRFNDRSLALQTVLQALHKGERIWNDVKQQKCEKVYCSLYRCVVSS